MLPRARLRYSVPLSVLVPLMLWGGGPAVRPNRYLADEDAMLQMYSILPDALARREVRLPLLFPWSRPVFQGSPLGVDTIRLSGASTRTVARSAIASHVAGCVEGLQGSEKAIRLDASYPEFAYSLTKGRTVIHTEKGTVVGWETAPECGVWRAFTPGDREWSGALDDQTSAVATNLAGYLSGEWVFYTVSRYWIDEFAATVIDRVTAQIGREPVLGLRIQFEGIACEAVTGGMLMAGYLVDGKRAGLWLYAFSNGRYVVQYYADGTPCGVRLERRSAGDVPYVLFWSKAEQFDVTPHFTDGVLTSLCASSEDELKAAVQISWDEEGLPSSVWIDATKETRYPFAFLGGSGTGELFHYLFQKGALGSLEGIRVSP